MKNPKHKAQLVSDIKTAIDQVVASPLSPEAKAAAYAGSVKLYLQMSRLIRREYEAVLNGLLEEARGAKKIAEPLVDAVGRKKVKLELAALYR